MPGFADPMIVRSIASVRHSDPRAGADPRAALSGGAAARMRVALFSGNYNCVRDGANTALNRLVAHLLERGASVRVYSPTVREPPFAPSGDLFSVPSLPIPGRPEYRLALGLPKAARDDLREFRPTLVHLSAPDLLNNRAQRFARSLGVPVVASMHTRFESYLDYYHLRALRPFVVRNLSRFYRGCDLVLAPTQADAEALAAMGVARARTRLWGRGVDQRMFAPELRNPAWRRHHGFAPEELVILFFGRLVLEKGIDTFAAAIAELRRRGHPIRPLIVGTGPAEKRMRRLVGDAVFTGHLDGRALGRAIASADILLNPSVTEAFGNVNLEAMAAGLAVVSADVASARALIDHGSTGLLPPPTSVEMADAVEAVLRDPQSRVSLGRAAASAAAAHDWCEILDGVIASYGSILCSFDSSCRGTGYRQIGAPDR